MSKSQQQTSENNSSVSDWLRLVNRPEQGLWFAETSHVIQSRVVIRWMMQAVMANNLKPTSTPRKIWWDGSGIIIRRITRGWIKIMWHTSQCQAGHSWGELYNTKEEKGVVFIRPLLTYALHKGCSRKV